MNKNISEKVKSVRQRAASVMGKPESFFLTFSTLFGFMFVFLTPPMQVYDERVHFLQAYAVSNLDFVPHKLEFNGQYHYGAELPRSVFVASEALTSNITGNVNAKFDKRLFGRYINQPLDPKVTGHQESGTSYSPIAYTPQAVGIAIGKIFNASPLIMIWLGRLANLTAWIAIVYLAIRLLPFGKWALVILALNPMAVFLSASLSADVMTTALAFLFFGLVMSIIADEVVTGKKKLAMLAVLGAAALTKPTNLLLGLIMLMIPWRRFRTKWGYICICFGGLVFAGIIALLWNHIVSDASLFAAHAQSSGRTIDPAIQLSGIIHAPWTYAKDILLNYVLVPAGYPGNFVLTASMGVLGWGEVNVPMWAIYLYVSGLFIALLHAFGRGTLLLTKSQKIVLVLTFVVFFIANVTALYLYLNGIGQSIIIGVQGRYFIPGVVLLTGLFTARRKILSIDTPKLAAALGLIVAMVLCATVLSIFLRFYH